MKKRLFYYGTVIPLLTMLGLTYAEYDSNKQIVFDTHKQSSRQLYLLSISHQARVDDQAMRHMAAVHRLQEHHANEVDELVIYYSEFIKELEDQQE